MSEKISYAVQRRLNKMPWQNVTTWRSLRETKASLKDCLKAEEHVSCINPHKYRLVKKIVIIDVWPKKEAKK